MSAWTWLSERFGHRTARRSLGARWGQPWHRYGWTEPHTSNRDLTHGEVPIAVVVSDTRAWFAGELIVAPSKLELQRSIADAAVRYAWWKHDEAEMAAKAQLQEVWRCTDEARAAQLAPESDTARGSDRR